MLIRNAFRPQDTGKGTFSQTSAERSHRNQLLPRTYHRSTRCTSRFSRIYYATNWFKYQFSIQARGSNVTWSRVPPLLPSGHCRQGVIVLLRPAVGGWGLGCVAQWREGGMTINIWWGAWYGMRRPRLSPLTDALHVPAPLVKYKNSPQLSQSACR